MKTSYSNFINLAKPQSLEVNREEIEKYLSDFYGEESATLGKDAKGLTLNLDKFREQGQKLYTALMKHHNIFEDLQAQFAKPDRDTTEQGINTFNRIKESAEAIHFHIAKQIEEGQEHDFNTLYSSYIINVCHDGAASNLDFMLAKTLGLTLGLEATLFQIKEEMLEQFILEFYKNNMHYLYQNFDLYPASVSEGHNVISIMNLVANDFNIPVREDNGAVNLLNAQYAQIIEQLKQRVLDHIYTKYHQNGESLMLELLEHKILAQLPEKIAGLEPGQPGYNIATDKIAEAVAELNIQDMQKQPLVTMDLIDINEDTYHIFGYQESHKLKIKIHAGICLQSKGYIQDFFIDVEDVYFIVNDNNVYLYDNEKTPIHLLDTRPQYEYARVEELVAIYTEDKQKFKALTSDDLKTIYAIEEGGADAVNAAYGNFHKMLKLYDQNRETFNALTSKQAIKALKAKALLIDLQNVYENDIDQFHIMISDNVIALYASEIAAGNESFTHLYFMYKDNPDKFKALITDESVKACKAGATLTRLSILYTTDKAIFDDLTSPDSCKAYDAGASFHQLEMLYINNNLKFQQLTSPKSHEAYEDGMSFSDLNTIYDTGNLSKFTTLTSHNIRLAYKSGLPIELLEQTYDQYINYQQKVATNWWLNIYPEHGNDFSHYLNRILYTQEVFKQLAYEDDAVKLPPQFHSLANTGVTLAESRKQIGYWAPKDMKQYFYGYESAWTTLYFLSFSAISQGEDIGRKIATTTIATSAYATRQYLIQKLYNFELEPTPIGSIGFTDFISKYGSNLLLDTALIGLSLYMMPQFSILHASTWTFTNLAPAFIGLTSSALNNYNHYIDGAKPKSPELTSTLAYYFPHVISLGITSKSIFSSPEVIAETNLQYGAEFISRSITAISIYTSVHQFTNLVLKSPSMLSSGLIYIEKQVTEFTKSAYQFIGQATDIYENLSIYIEEKIQEKANEFTESTYQFAERGLQSSKNLLTTSKAHLEENFPNILNLGYNAVSYMALHILNTYAYISSFLKQENINDQTNDIDTIEQILQEVDITSWNKINKLDNSLLSPGLKILCLTSDFHSVLKEVNLDTYYKFYYICSNFAHKWSNSMAQEEVGEGYFYNLLNILHTEKILHLDFPSKGSLFNYHNEGISLDILQRLVNTTKAKMQKSLPDKDHTGNILDQEDNTAAKLSESSEKQTNPLVTTALNILCRSNFFHNTYVKMEGQEYCTTNSANDICSSILNAEVEIIHQNKANPLPYIYSLLKVLYTEKIITHEDYNEKALPHIIQKLDEEKNLYVQGYLSARLKDESEFNTSFHDNKFDEYEL